MRKSTNPVEGGLSLGTKLRLRKSRKEGGTPGETSHMLRGSTEEEGGGGNALTESHKKGPFTFP